MPPVLWGLINSIAFNNTSKWLFASLGNDVTWKSDHSSTKPSYFLLALNKNKLLGMEFSSRNMYRLKMKSISTGLMTSTKFIWKNQY